MDNQLNENQIYDEHNLGDEEEPVNGDLWKKFGRGNDVGNLLYGMYSQKEKPKINYPAVRTKKKPTPMEEQKMPKNIDGACPQKT
jgi:hypothetical protein